MKPRIIIARHGGPGEWWFFGRFPDGTLCTIARVGCVSVTEAVNAYCARCK